MRECGLLIDTPISFDKDTISNSLQINNNNIIGIITPSKKSKQVNISGYMLTSIGIQLYEALCIVDTIPVIVDDVESLRKKSNNMYFLLCLYNLKRKFKTLDIKAHLIKQPFDRANFENNTYYPDKDLLYILSPFVTVSVSL